MNAAIETKTAYPRMFYEQTYRLQAHKEKPHVFEIVKGQPEFKAIKWQIGGCPEAPQHFAKGIVALSKLEAALWRYGIAESSIPVDKIIWQLRRGETVIVTDQRGPHILKIKFEQNQRYSEDVCRFYRVK